MGLREWFDEGNSAFDDRGTPPNCQGDCKDLLAMAAGGGIMGVIIRIRAVGDLNTSPATFRRTAMHSAVVTPPRMDPAYEVEQQLQGTWVQVSGRWNCQMFFAGHHFAIRFQNGEVYMGVYTIDPSE